MVRRSIASFLLSLAAVLLPSVLMADVTGTILGVVADASSAVIQGVKVTATNVDTNLATDATTDVAGQYRFLSLPAGRYQVQAVFSGFQTFIETGIVLTVDEQRRVDIVLRVGATQQEVNVNATALQVETTNTQLGDVSRRKEDHGTAAQRPEFH